jgi:parallel beta-helix repeat protein
MKESSLHDIPAVLALCMMILGGLAGCGQKTTEIRAINFGAIPDDNQDDTKAIQSAIDACIKSGASRLKFEFGTYDISGTISDGRGNFKPSVVISDAENLTIEGNGAEFTGHNYSSMFHFINCSNITLNNIYVDWYPLPYTQGKVIKVDTGYVDIKVMDPFIAVSGLHTQAILGYDPERQRMGRRFTDHYQLDFGKPTEVVAPGIMRLFIGHLDRFAGHLPDVGTEVIARHQVYGYQSFELIKCSDVNFENVNIYSNPGMGITGRDCRDVSLSHVKIMIRPGSGRWMSCTADATNFVGCRGTVTMENCLFEGMGDDATNVRSGEYLVVDEKLNNNVLVVKKGYRYGGKVDPPEPGDKIEISGKDKLLLPYATLTVRSVKENAEDKTTTMTFREDLPEQTVKGDIIGDASSCPVLRIRNCTVYRNRSRGLIVKTRNVIIEDCTFRDICASAIGLEADVNAWWESIGSADVIIRNNMFIDCRYDPEYLQGVIESHTMSQTAPAGVHRRITIANNIFLGSGSNILKLGSAEGVKILNNIFDGATNEAILLYNSSDILLQGNRFTNCRIPLMAGDGCDRSAIKTVDNKGL